ncbi:MAG: response regulator [Candidatus Hydrogenedentes bacterium]|nr:response regulator [Candidatus Hydrogenedentota bacterium]
MTVAPVTPEPLDVAEMSRRRPKTMRVQRWRVGVAAGLLAALLLETLARFIQEGGGIFRPISEFLSFLALLILALPAVLLIRRLEDVPILRWTAYWSALSMCLAQLVNFASELHPYLTALPPSSGVDFVERMFFLAGVVLLIATLYFALIETLRAKTELLFESHELAREATLRRKSERYARALLDNALDVITVVNRDGTIRSESPSIEHVLKYRPEELTGRDIHDMIHPEDRSKLDALLAAECAEEAAPSSIRYQTANGAWRVLESIGCNLLDDPDIHGVVLNSRDITERLNLEQQLLQAQKMESIGRLAGGVAHDFNNLLTAIVGYSDLSADAIKDEVIRGHIQQIRLAADRAASLTRQLLAFARKQMVVPRVIDISEIVHNLEKMLRRLIGEHIELQTHTRASGHIFMDASQLEQLLVNLVVNARDAMPSGGTIIIETSDQTLDEEYVRHRAEVKSGQYVVLTVSDTGEGMTPEVQAQIFEPFFTTKERGKGTGLGLATCYGIVKQAEGHIWVYSEPGRGSTFRIYLPLAASKGERPAAEEPAVAAGAGSETILLVEDDALVRRIAAQTLRDQGYNVLVAESGVEALKIAAEHAKIDALVTDVVMPLMGGRQLSELLLKERPGLKVLYVSGYTDDALIQQGVLEEGMDFLPKPFTPASLSRKLRAMLG